ncbi:MAG TPA: LysR family transcriptional regulator [Terriglobales bacterium]|nr:LysR family transcriptional regulator [Terriglobales bacterium]
MLANLSDGDIRLLRIFAKVVEAGGFSAAQIDLNISQSTISTHMTALEQRLGVRLCQRGRAGFSLTEKGQRIYQASQRLFASLDEFRSEAGAVRNRLVGKLTIGIVDNIVTNPASRLHQAINTMNTLAPEVEMAVLVFSPTELERAVLDRRCDLGFGACGRHSPYLAYEDVFEERQVLYCGRGHPLFEGSQSASLAELKGQQLVRRAYAAPDNFPAGMQLTSSAVADLMESVAAFILSGRYIGFLPQHFAQQWVDQDLMRPLLERKLGYQNPIYLTTRKTEQQTPILAAFLKELMRAHQPAAVTKEKRVRRAG